MKAINEAGYENPTSIQSQAIPILLEGPTDFLGLAATGTGKTAAFSIPLLEQIDPKKKVVQALILCPTRELALQVAGQIEILGKYKGIRSLAVYGGASYTDQIHGLKNGISVVVGTPGRVVDHINRGTLKLDGMSTLILDEADEMISMGFREELEKIMGAVSNKSSRIWFFSATMDKQVSKITNQYLRNPKKVQVNGGKMLSETVEQIYYSVRESDKAEVLCKLIESVDDFYGLIFCQTKQMVTDLNSYLVDKGYKVDSLHGDKDQNARERTMQSFRDRKVRILVCTDVASRGLDVKDITHVINYSLPRELESYVHRIGRTARSGKKGIAMNLVTPSHRRLIFQIENHTQSRMKEGILPTRKEIGTRKVAQILPKFSEQAMHTRAQEIMGTEWKTLLQGMSAEEVAGRFLAMLMPDLFNEKASRESASKASEAASADDRGRGRGDSGGRGRSGDRGSDRRSYGGEGRDRRPSASSNVRGPRGFRSLNDRDDRATTSSSAGSTSSAGGPSRRRDDRSSDAPRSAGGGRAFTGVGGGTRRPSRTFKGTAASTASSEKTRSRY